MHSTAPIQAASSPARRRRAAPWFIITIGLIIMLLALVVARSLPRPVDTIGWQPTLTGRQLATAGAALLAAGALGLLLVTSGPRRRNRPVVGQGMPANPLASGGPGGPERPPESLAPTVAAILGHVRPYLSLEEVAQAGAESIAAQTAFRRVAILTEETMGHALACQGRAGPVTVVESGATVSLSDADGLIQQTYFTGRLHAVPLADGAVAMTAALWHGRSVFGVLLIEVETETDETRPQLRTLAAAVAQALDNARHFADMRQNAIGLSSLFHVSRIANRSLELDTVLPEAIYTGCMVLGFRGGLICLAERPNGQALPAQLPEAGPLRVMAHHGLDLTDMARWPTSRMNETIFGLAHELGHALVLSDTLNPGPEWHGWLATRPERLGPLAATGVRSLVSIPLRHDDRSIGTFNLIHDRPATVSSDDLAIMVGISRQLSLAVANSRLFRHVAEERSRLQALLEASHYGIIFVGSDQTIHVLNDQARHFLNLPDRPDGWTGQELPQLVAALKGAAPEASQTLAEAMARLQAGEEVPTAGEIAAAPYVIRWNRRAVQSGDHTIGQLILLRDITDELTVARMRDDLTRLTVHDMRNPITAIDVSLQLLERTDDLDRRHRLLDNARRNTARIKSLVDLLLDISQLESGQMPLKPTMVDLAPLAQDVVTALAPMAQQKEITLAQTIDESLPPVIADPALLERVLRNLIGNALKFTPPGGSVSVGAGFAVTHEGPQVEVRVTDSGPGIPASIRESLFGKFVAGHQEERGNGLGLAFCKMVLEAHGQQIWVAGSGPAGTTLAFTLAPVPDPAFDLEPDLAEADVAFDFEPALDEPEPTSAPYAAPAVPDPARASTTDTEKLRPAIGWEPERDSPDIA